jgi:Kef-type K+ transport system membrane component KefB
MQFFGSLNMFICVGATLFLGFLLKLLVSDRFRFPAVTLYVAVGVLLGISVLRVFGEQAVEALGFISRLGVGLIAFIIGSEFDAKTLRQLGRPIIVIGILESVGAFVLVSAAVLLFYPHKPEYALILGAVSSATAPAATVFVIRQYKAKGPLTSTIMGVVGFDDASSLMIFVFASLFAETILSGQGVHVAQMIFRPLVTIAESIGLGVGIGLLAWVGLRKVRDADNLLMAVFGLILVQLGLADALRLSDLMTIMSFSVFLTNANLMLGHRTKASLERLSPVLLPLFFILAGARLDVRLIGRIGILGLVYTGARMAGKISGASLGAVISGAPKVVRRFIGLSLFPQVGVAIAMALAVKNRFDTPQYGADGKTLAELVINILLFTTLITEVVGPLVTRATLAAADETFKGD